MQDKVISDIYLTNEHGQFKMLSGNRKVRTNRKLEDSILEKGILKPIAVNSNMEIIDGQHRFSIAQKYDLPVPYYVTVNKALDEIIELNNTSIKWSLKDYINKYANDGLIEYIQLKNLLENYSFIATSDLICALSGSLRSGSKILDKVKDGSFAIKDLTGILPILESYQQLLESTEIKSVSAVFIAYFNLATVKKFESEWFVKKVNELNTGRKILGVKKADRIIKEFLESYNHNLMESAGRYIDYKLTTKRTIQILEPRLDNLINYELN